MRSLRKYALLSAVCGLALGAMASTASAYQYLGNYGSGPVAVPDGTFGENVALQTLPAPNNLALTVTLGGPGGPQVTNRCDANIGGFVFLNDTSQILRIHVPAHTFSNCDHAPAWGSGTWVFKLPQNSQNNDGTYQAFMDQIKVLVNLGGGSLCEFRGAVNIRITNGDLTLPGPTPTTARVSGSLSPYTGAGTASVNCPVVTPGQVLGFVKFIGTTNFANNLIVG